MPLLLSTLGSGGDHFSLIGQSQEPTKSNSQKLEYESIPEPYPQYDMINVPREAIMGNIEGEEYQNIQGHEIRKRISMEETNA